MLLDEVPGNGESWFLARCFERLRREGFVGVVAHSDPLRRVLPDGTVVTPRHVGVIYQAHNGVYLGRTRARYERVGVDGRTLGDRTINKLLHGEQGHRYAAAMADRAGGLESLGRVRHPGKHKFAWYLSRRGRALLPPSLPYPKQIDTL